MSGCRKGDSEALVDLAIVGFEKDVDSPGMFVA